MTDETIVYVNSSASDRTVYHTGLCAIRPNEVEQWTRDTARARGLRECEECADSVYQYGKPQEGSESLRDGMVYVATNSSKAPEAYHTRECSRAPAEGARRIQPVEIARARGLSECQHCTGDAIQGGEHGPQLAAKLKRIGEANSDE